MEFAMKILVAALIAIIVVVVIVAFTGGFSGEASGAMKNIYNWFSGIMGGGKVQLPVLK